MSYQITDLGTLPGDTGSFAMAINNSGQVIGESSRSASNHAFIWDATNGMQDLGTLPGDSGSVPYGINDSGQVVGYSQGSGGPHAFLWDAVNGMQDLGTLPGGDASRALGINNSGQVVGWSFNPNTTLTHAFLWDATNGMQDLGTLGSGNSMALAINNSGQAVGWSFNSDRTSDAFLWDAVNGMQDLGTLPGDAASIAFGINDSGQVVGESESLTTHAFLWDAVNGMVDLGNLGRGAYATSINSNGQVVGAAEVYCPIVNDYFYDPFVWQNGTMSDLNDLITPGSGVTIVAGYPGIESQPPAINNAGQIVGSGGPFNGQSHAILLTPDSSPLPAGKVQFTRSDAQAVLLADSTVTTADARVHPFSLTLSTRGDQTPTGTDPAEATRMARTTVPLTSAAATPAGPSEVRSPCRSGPWSAKPRTTCLPASAGQTYRLRRPSGTSPDWSSYSEGASHAIVWRCPCTGINPRENVALVPLWCWAGARQVGQVCNLPWLAQAGYKPAPPAWHLRLNHAETRFISLLASSTK